MLRGSLVVGQKVYMLEGHEPQLDKLAGTHVTLKGRVSDDTVAVESVRATQGLGQKVVAENDL